MFTFAYPHLLFLLAIIPIVALLYIYARYTRQCRIRRFGNPQILSPLMPEVSKYKPAIKLTLELLALLMIIICVCRPWGAMRDRTENREGIEIVIAMDVSNSMLASSTNDEGAISRLKTSKIMLEKLLGKLDNDKVGLLVYAGEAYTLLPVTSDYVSAKTFVNSINTDMVPIQGTAIAEAIHRSIDLFNSKDGGRAIILITDAEDLEGDAIQAVKDAAKSGIQVDVVGVGSPNGTRIQLPQGEYMLDDEGNVVVTKLNEDLGVKMAEAGKGIYVNAANGDAIPELLKQLGAVKKSAWNASIYAVHEELFVIFAILAIIFLVADLFMLDRKIGWLSKITFFRKEDRK